jgi:hypothetical protein
MWRRVRSALQRQPASHSTREGGPVLVESTAFYRVSARLSKVSSLQKTATLARICRKSPAQTAEIPVFVETIGGDRFDLHCVVGLVVGFGCLCAALAEEHAVKM